MTKTDSGYVQPPTEFQELQEASDVLEELRGKITIARAAKKVQMTPHLVILDKGYF